MIGIDVWEKLWLLKMKEVLTEESSNDWERKKNMMTNDMKEENWGEENTMTMKMILWWRNMKWNMKWNKLIYDENIMKMKKKRNVY